VFGILISLYAWNSRPDICILSPHVDDGHIHNLSAYAWGNPAVHPFDWALRFKKNVRELIQATMTRLSPTCHNSGISFRIVDSYFCFPVNLNWQVILKKTGNTLSSIFF